MSRFVIVNLTVGLLAAAIGFGDFAGIPSQAVFVARAVAGLCLLLVVAYFISSFRPAEQVRRRPPRDHRPPSRQKR